MVRLPPAVGQQSSPNGTSQARSAGRGESPCVHASSFYRALQSKCEAPVRQSAFSLLDRARPVFSFRQDRKEKMGGAPPQPRPVAGNPRPRPRRALLRPAPAARNPRPRPRRISPRPAPAGAKLPSRPRRGEIPRPAGATPPPRRGGAPFPPYQRENRPYSSRSPADPYTSSTPSAAPGRPRRASASCSRNVCQKKFARVGFSSVSSSAASP